nr:hypothetical protein CKG001_25340 [Bdellovibrio sp. CKG001]
MNNRNVMILILGTVLLSVCSALLAVHLTQDKTSQVVSEKILPPDSPASTLNPDKASSKATPLSSVPATTTMASSQTAMPVPISAPDAAAYLDHRRPLSADEVQTTLLKATPDCKEDYKKLCLANPYLAEHPLACLRHHKEQLSRACFNQVTAVRDQFQKDCGADIQRLCPKQSSYFGCLKQQLASLSPACRNNIQQFSRR